MDAERGPPSHRHNQSMTMSPTNKRGSLILTRPMPTHETHAQTQTHTHTNTTTPHHQRLQIQRHQDPTPQHTRSYTSDAIDDSDSDFSRQPPDAVVCLMCKCSFALLSVSNLQYTARNTQPAISRPPPFPPSKDLVEND